MSALGQKRTLEWRPLMSALPPKADIRLRGVDVRFVPKADIRLLINDLVLCGRRGRKGVPVCAVRGVAVAVAWKTAFIDSLGGNAARRSGAGSRSAMVSFEDFVNGGKECLRNG
jgi:hypothetical protein